MSNIIHDADRVTALIREARKFAADTLRAAEEVEDEVRAFSQDRARARMPYGHQVARPYYTNNVIPFPDAEARRAMRGGRDRVRSR